MLDTMELWSGISDVRLEGMDSIVTKYKALCDTVKKKSYDILDHRKGDFDADYTDFKTQFDNLHQQVQNFLDTWFDRNLSVSQISKNFTVFHKKENWWSTPMAETGTYAVNASFICFPHHCWHQACSIPRVVNPVSCNVLQKVVHSSSCNFFPVQLGMNDILNGLYLHIVRKSV